ncbi:MAG: hemolysin III [Gammaproteobacteria bacterium]|nr:MAG: hemolysin III [Gammaproteobacteria bacterium]
MSTAEYTIAEEITNSITHGLGVLFSITALTLLVAYSAMNGDAWHVVASSVYGSSLIIMYSASTLYHSVFHIKAKAVLKQLDHAAIYILIAGTYTPYFLISLRDSAVWYLFPVIWALAILGVFFEFVHIKFLKKISLVLYLGMGWLAIFIINPMMETIETNGLILLLAGGLAYSFGVIFYVWEKLPFNHAIWHLFVLAGSVLHFCSIFIYVIP